ncbi:MAG: hypothetical protein ABSE49_09735 [Polyangiaceae bacterium]|jgi:hypothetical protein
MKTIGTAWMGCAAILLTGTLGACGSGASPEGSSGGGASSSGGASGSSSSGGSGFGSSSGVSSGGSSSSGVGGSSSGPSSGSSSSGVGSGSSSGASGGGSSSGTTSAGYGSLTFEQCSGSSALCGGETSAQFYGEFDQGAQNQGCQVTTTEACSFYVCGNTVPTVGVDAGILAIWGGSIPPGTAIEPTTGDVGQYSYLQSTELFSAGQVLHVESTGSTVPLFGPVSLVAPAALNLIAPLAVGGAYTIPTSADLSVAWTPGQAPAQTIVEGAGNSGGAQSYFLCQWDATIGSGTIPAAVLQPLAGQAGGFFVYGQLTTASADAGGYALTMTALQYSGGTASFE